MIAADVLLLVGKLNLALAAAIVIVLALRPLVRRRLGARMTYALWLLPLVAMLASLVPPRTVVHPARVGAETPVMMADGSFPDVLEGFGAAPAAPIHFDPYAAAMVLWIAGAAVALFGLARLQRRFAAGAKRGEVGPAVVGLISPRIITPCDFATRFDAEEQALVLAHEQVHIRRQDSRLNALAAGIQCLFWFNPLIHIGILPMRIDQELACDAAVVSRFPEARHVYARALVKSQLANRPLPLGCYWPSGTRHPLLERIAMLKSAELGARSRLAGGAALAALFAAFGFAAWAANPPKIVYAAAKPRPAPAAPTPQERAAQPPAVTTPAPKAASSAEPKEPADVCLTNACAEAQPETPAPPPPMGHVYVGAGPVPAGQAFARYFDGSKPALIRGRVVEVRMTDGMSLELVVDGGDGQRFRVTGPDPARITPEQRAQFQDLVGTTTVIRGYMAHDTSCEGGGCLMNGRDVAREDGSSVFGRGAFAPQASQSAPQQPSSPPS